MKVVLCNGCFDVLHYGHVRHLQAAKKLGDRLVVSLTVDAHVNKGPNRPIFPDIIRKQVLEALRCVDQVILVDNSFQALHLVRPNVYVKGKEYKGKLIKGEVEYCKAHDIEIAFTEQEYSTTKLINELRRG